MCEHRLSQGVERDTAAAAGFALLDAATLYHNQEAIKKQVSKFLDSANKRSREIFTARYYFNFSISEIAHSFDMSETAVKSRLSRTRAELKKYLSERGVTV